MLTDQKIQEANDFMISEAKIFKDIIPDFILNEKNPIEQNKMLFVHLHNKYLERLDAFGRKEV